MAEKTEIEIKGKPAEVEKEGAGEEVSEVEEMADKIEQKSEGSAVASVAIPEANEVSSQISCIAIQKPQFCSHHRTREENFPNMADPAFESEGALITPQYLKLLDQNLLKFLPVLQPIPSALLSRMARLINMQRRLAIQLKPPKFW